jgi:hypothetical protein
MDRQLSKAVFGLLTVIELLVIEFIAGPLFSYQQLMLQEHNLVLVIFLLIMLLKIVQWNHQSIVGLACDVRRAFENFGLFRWDYFSGLTL